MLKQIIAVVIALVPLLAVARQPESPPQGMKNVSTCSLSGGEVIPQPAGSSVETCCNADGCIVCGREPRDSDCSFDPAYSSRPQGRQPALNSAGTMAPPSQVQTGLLQAAAGTPAGLEQRRYHGPAESQFPLNRAPAS